MSDKLPEGLCGNRGDHESHEHEDSTLGKFWCHADQERREPSYAGARRTALKRTARRGH